MAKLSKSDALIVADVSRALDSVLSMCTVESRTSEIVLSDTLSALIKDFEDKSYEVFKERNLRFLRRQAKRVAEKFSHVATLKCAHGPRGVYYSGKFLGGGLGVVSEGHGVYTFTFTTKHGVELTYCTTYENSDKAVTTFLNAVAGSCR